MNDPEWPDDVARGVGRQELGEDREALPARAAIRLHQRTRRRAKTCAPHGIPEQLEERGLELTGVADLDRGLVVQERLRNLREVLHVGTKDDWLPEHRRFEDIVASSVHERAPDEAGGVPLIELGELANRVEDDDVVPRLRIHAQLAPSSDVPARLTREPIDLLEPFRFPRRDDEERSGYGGADPLERFERGALLASQRARSDDHGTRRRHAEVTQEDRKSTR